MAYGQEPPPAGAQGYGAPSYGAQGYGQPSARRTPDGIYEAPNTGAGHDLATRQESPRAAQNEPMAELERRYSEACPMHVSGTEVTAQSVPNGAALVFTTSDEDVDRLREQVDRFAEAHNELAQKMSQEGQEAEQSGNAGAQAPGAGAMYGEQAQGGTQSMQGMEHGAMEHGSMEHGQPMMGQASFIPSRAQVEEIDGGAEVILTPRDPGELQALRQHVEQQARQMASGACPLLGPSAPQGGNEIRTGAGRAGG
jgi:hypothetical protein